MRRLAMFVPILAMAATQASGGDEPFAQCANRDPDVAIPACTAAFETGGLDPASLPIVLAQRADAFARKYDYDRAIRDYNRAIKLRPDDPSLFEGRGLAHANRSNFELAVKDYDRAIQLDPADAKAFYRRGLAKFGLCDIDGADADIARARELDPGIEM
jgi:Flp pilus assembly protein TadD